MSLLKGDSAVSPPGAGLRTSTPGLTPVLSIIQTSSRGSAGSGAPWNVRTAAGRSALAQLSTPKEGWSVLLALSPPRGRCHPRPLGAGLFLCTSPELERARAVEQVSLCPAPAGGMCPGAQTSQAPHNPVTIRGNRPSGWTCLSDGETSAVHKHVQTTTGQAQGSGAHMMGPGGLEVEGAGLPAVTKLTVQGSHRG